MLTFVSRCCAPGGGPLVVVGAAAASSPSPSPRAGVTLSAPSRIQACPGAALHLSATAPPGRVVAFSVHSDAACGAAAGAPQPLAVRTCSSSVSPSGLSAAQGAAADRIEAASSLAALSAARPAAASSPGPATVQASSTGLDDAPCYADSPDSPYNGQERVRYPPISRWHPCYPPKYWSTETWMRDLRNSIRGDLMA